MPDTSPILVVGSMALDTITTPHGTREAILGGAACYFSVGARLFAPVRLVGVVGEDFPEEHVALLRDRGVDLAGLERRPGGETFRWAGSYEGRMDVAETLRTELNVLGEFRPTLPEHYRDTPFVFLANGDPVTQGHVLDQMHDVKFAMLDTMNFWIDSAREALIEVMRRVDGVVMNDDEARALGESANLIRAMQNIAGLGVRTLIVKKGEHGSVLLHDGELFALPAHPLEEVVDPTGAGDSFASGVMGALARSGDLSFRGFKSALATGTVVASFTVESFGLAGLLAPTPEAIARRLEAFTAFVQF